MKEVSIIIRTKNEERWISSCLQAINNQSFKDFEIIIVDNNSTDQTINKIKKFNIKKIFTIDKYLPGKSLNIGIRESEGKYIVCLSAHCIPVDEKWLGSLVESIKSNGKFAGVYGRQQPMSFSKPQDKRDMLIAFGLDKKIQFRDSFFHNANSILKKSLWNEVNFDENVTNIEDRIWAQEMINKNLQIMYDPDASVYHYHGIHQDGDETRLNNVIKIIESKQPHEFTAKLDPEKLNIIAIIPLKGDLRYLNDQPLIEFTIQSIKKCKFIDKIIVSTDSEETAKIAKTLGAESPFLRPKTLSEKHVNLETVQKYTLDKIEQNGIFPDLVFLFQETFPFRPDNLIENMINHLLTDGYDTVIAAKKESSSQWHEANKGKFIRIDSGDVPREFKEKHYSGLPGLGCITHPEFIRNNQIEGNKTGLFPIDYPLSSLEVRDETSLRIAEKIIRSINKNNN
tara:strand:- start:17329 stop:18690 length:1362 start_codon:yes stop_codon:yes gene_type:complete